MSQSPFIKKIHSIEELRGLYAVLGLQFENLLLGNRGIIHKSLNILDSQIISSAPYVQRKTSINKGACQIDLLIHTDLDVFYLCEFKCQKTIDKSVIKEVKQKMEKLKLPRRASLKPVLIYEGDFAGDQEETIKDFFYRVISFDNLLQVSE